MVWNFINDTVNVLNGIGISVTETLPSLVFHFFISFLKVLYYPIGLGYYFLTAIWAYLYSLFAMFYNMLISIVNIPITILTIYFNLPSQWVTLMYVSLTISMLVRGYKWIKEIRGWIPTLSGDK